MKKTFLDSLIAAKSTKHPTVVVTDLETGAQTLWVDSTATGDIDINTNLSTAIEKALRRDKAETLDDSGKRYFLQPFPPPKRMIVVGAVHIAQALVPMAKLSGYEVLIIDPRQAFASKSRFPGVTLNHSWPDEAMTELDPDRRTAVVTLTHDPKLDDPALMVALRSNAFYIGSLGSKRTHAKRLERLRESGLLEEELKRINAPIGLDIGAVSPAEIAISVMAQITANLHAPEKRVAA
ncbi:MAG: xanthine dehydrogenase [Rickettsiales bacterium]|nr:xanthine dehydrogenase [Rickettsiales bacterium]|tara:strand:- start:1099 stop:1809 length:711 start_codon:yes stop_codon:yes gene_type:complete